MTPAPQNRGQPTTFLPGTFHNVWSTRVGVNSTITWILAGVEAAVTVDAPVAINPDTTGALLNVRKTGAPKLIVTDQRFIAYAPGGATIFTTADNSVGAHLAPNSGSWSFISDVRRKRDLELINGDAVLDRLRALPISTWSYTSQSGVRHMGPTAQDFHHAFGLGESDTTISVVDAAGVALAAVKALDQRVRELEARIAQMSAPRGETAPAADTLLNIRKSGVSHLVVTDTALTVAAPAGAVIFSNAANSLGVSLAAGSGSWSMVSDVRKKTAMHSVDSNNVLEGLRTLPVWRWSYTAQGAVRHMGPTSQDFAQAFHLGEDSTSIAEVDAFGVSLAAARAILERVEKIDPLLDN